MKVYASLFLAVFAVSCSDQHTDAEITASSFKTELYFAEPLLCEGKIVAKPRDMHDDYSQILMQVISFKSMRKDGTWANSLEVSNAYFGKDESIDHSASFVEAWYMGPLKISGKQVSRDSLSGRGDNLTLTIKRSSVLDGKRTDVLEGTYAVQGSVVGDYAYSLKCTANVVNEPSRRDDNTVPN